jgi:sphingomyelin phosphodiesterase acid-like 3
MGGFMRSDWRLVFACCFLLSAGAWAHAQPASQPAAVQALMVSDIHFEPFWDPGKIARLNAAPASAWKAILAAPETPGRAAGFAALQQQCGARGTDTSYPLFASSLQAMQAHAAGARFITVSGDLIAHQFSCKFAVALPHALPGDYGKFVEKTIVFVLAELRASLPGVRVYAALGNNDSDCGDYRLDARGAFLASEGPVFAAALPAADRKRAAQTFAEGGNYSAELPAPIRNARIVVLDDLFQSSRYRSCAGKSDPAPAAEQIAWLRSQLEDARRAGRRLWVMAHIPTGVDPYSTARKMRDLCGGEDPVMFLSSDALAQTLAGFGDAIRLVIFAHTHMDELRLLQPAQSGAPAVAVKMVSSISPVDGNNPSFTVAEVDPETAELADYRVIEASNQTGVGAQWSEEYDFDSAYGESGFSAASVARLIGQFSHDPAAVSPASREYLHNYFIRDESVVLKAFWPQYVCALGNDAGAAYRSCVCPAQRQSALHQ